MTVVRSPVTRKPSYGNPIRCVGRVGFSEFRDRRPTGPQGTRSVGHECRDGFAATPFDCCSSVRATREAGLLIGLRDTDERVFRLALFAAMRGATAGTARTLMHRAEDPRLPEELRARAIRALAATGRPEAMQWLVDHASVDRRSGPAISRSWLSRGGRLRR